MCVFEEGEGWGFKGWRRSFSQRHLTYQFHFTRLPKPESLETTYIIHTRGEKGREERGERREKEGPI